MPASGDGNPPAVGAVEALQDHQVAVERGVAAEMVGSRHQVRVEQGQNDGAPVALCPRPEALEPVAVARHEAAVAVLLREQPRDQLVLRRDVVALQVGVVERMLHVEAPAPALVDIEEAVAEDVPAHPAAVLGRGAGLGDAGVDGVLAVLRALAVLAGQHDRLVGGEARREGQVAMGRERPVVGDRHVHTEGPRAAVDGGQEAAPARDAGIGMAEVGRVEDGHAEELERGIVVGEIVIGLIVDHGPGLDLPERRPGGLVGAQRAGREHRLAHHRAVAVDATRAAGDDPRVVGHEDAQAVDDAVSQVAGKLDGIGEQHLAAGLAQRDVAGGDHHAVALPVADACGTQHALALGDLDVAGRDDRVGGLVVGQLVGPHQQIAGGRLAGGRQGDGLLRAHLERGKRQQTREDERREGSDHADAIRPRGGTGRRRRAG